jgi:hypothetical protein
MISATNPRSLQIDDLACQNSTTGRHKILKYGNPVGGEQKQKADSTIQNSTTGRHKILKCKNSVGNG